MGLERGILSKFGLFWSALKKFDGDHGFLLSAGITFNLLICLVPLILLLLALLGVYLYSDREVSKQLFGWYVLHLGRFSAVYGSLSTLAIFFLWFYYSSAILLLGGEVAFLLEKRGNGING